MSNEVSAHIPVPVLVMLDGKSYLMQLPTIAGFKELEKHCQSEILNEIATIAKAVPPTMAEPLTAPLVERYKNCKIGLPSFDAEIIAPSNLAYTIWMLFRTKQPAMTFEEASALLTFENIPTIMQKMEEIKSPLVVTPKATA